MICRMLQCVRTIFLGIWRVERYVIFWSSWLIGPSSSSTVVPFCSVMHVFRSAALCLWSVLCVSQIFFSKMPSPFLLQFVFKHSVSILCKLYSFNWYKFLITALFLFLNNMLQCLYFGTVLKTIMDNNITCFCLQTLTMYRKLYII